MECRNFSHAPTPPYPADWEKQKGNVGKGVGKNKKLPFYLEVADIFCIFAATYHASSKRANRKGNYGQDN